MSSASSSKKWWLSWIHCSVTGGSSREYGFSKCTPSPADSE
jgi:hypothetical protein